jgi:shikimate kinase
VVLIGGSGAGKSSLALHLARLLELPARDSDQRVVAHSGQSIAALFADEGEAGFRALEARAVREELAAPCVLALGGGAWEDPATREAVRAAGFAALWLAEVPERAWARVGRDPSRPLAAAREQFVARWVRRTPAWSLAPMVLPLGRSPEALAEALLR